VKGQPLRVVLEKRNSRLGVEEELVASKARSLGIQVVVTTEKIVSRGFFMFKDTDLVVGGVMFMKHALRAYGKELVEHTPYPLCLNHLLYRNVGHIRSLKDAKYLLDQGQKFFIKPDGWKCFTGFVAEHSDDFRFNGTSNQQPVFTSDVVEFLTEWRVYVVDGRVRAVRWANAGTQDLVPNYAEIERAVFEFKVDGSPAGYAIDFGVLSTGETALVEVNDGFSIGAYGDHLEGTYWDMVSARWQQLIGVQWDGNSNSDLESPEVQV
jgi:hypothetical protein